MSNVNELDIWGCDPVITMPGINDFDLIQATFDQTFNKTIEDVEEEQITVSTNDEAVNVPISSETNKDTNTASRGRRIKAQRQDTLSGNNPFRKESPDEIFNSENESPFMTILRSVGVVDQSNSAEGFDPLSTIYPDSGDERNRTSQNSDSDVEGFQPFKIKTNIKDENYLEPRENNDVISILPAPKDTSAVKVPRERKLPPENKCFRQPKNDLVSDDIFFDLRNSENKSNLNTDKEKSPTHFESPLSGPFSSEQIEWEAFPSKKQSVNEDDRMVWGDDTEFKAEFEPLPHEIITFEPFNHVNENLEWKLLIRQPEKKSKAKQISRYTSNRWWKDVYIRLAKEKERPCLKLFDNLEDAEPYRTVRIEPYMQVSRDKLQQYDKYGKLHIFRVNHVVYKEMVGMRSEKFSLKTLQNFVSHKPKMNIVLDHMSMKTEIVKFGSLDKKPLKSFMAAIEDSLLSIKSHRDTSLQYSKEEVCCYVNDEYICELTKEGSIVSHKARTRIFFSAFVSDNPYIILGINDKWRFGNEIVRRQDIIPIVHDDWITIYEPEFHSCIDMIEYEKDHMIKFYPLDGCRFELMRFRVPLRPNKEQPLSVDVKIKINGSSVDIRTDLTVPGFFSVSKRHGAVHCDDIEIRVPIPEQWAYHFRDDNHAIHSALRKPGKIKGFERITQLAQSFLPTSMLEASVGVAKYEHLFRAIVWRIPRLPEKNEASYKPHLMTCKFILAPQDVVPCLKDMCKTFDVEFNMAASTVSGATIRSISVEHTSTPERFVKYLAAFKYTRVIRYDLGDIKPPAVTSILDQSSDLVDDVHSSEESLHERSSVSEIGNYVVTRSPCNSSVDLLGINQELERDKSANDLPHSAMEDLLTLDCFTTQSSTTNQALLHLSNLDDIAMVDDDGDEECG